MKKLLFIQAFASFFLLTVCSGQSYKYVYNLDENLAITKASKAIVTGRGLNENGQFRLDYFLKKDGILFMSAHYLDSSLATMQGSYKEFYKTGRVRTEGDYLNDEKNGPWVEYDTLGLKTDSVDYKNGKAFTTTKMGYHKNGKLSYHSFKDSLADIYKSVAYDDKGAISTEVFFKGQSGIYKSYDSLGQVKVDSLFTREENEASFPGGQAGWIKYLQQNLNASTPVDNGAPIGAYQVIVKFIVAKDGSISGVVAETNFGYGMEKEVIRIIKSGPAWIPAVQYGRKVNAYRRQPVTFMVSNK